MTVRFNATIANYQSRITGHDLRFTFPIPHSALRIFRMPKEEIAEIEFRFEALKPYLKPDPPRFGASTKSASRFLTDDTARRPGTPLTISASLLSA
jgi:hypothetical protein